MVRGRERAFLFPALMNGHSNPSCTPICRVTPGFYGIRRASREGDTDIYAIPSPDGHRLAMYGWKINSNMWMLENFLRQASAFLQNAGRRENRCRMGSAASADGGRSRKTQSGHREMASAALGASPGRIVETAAALALARSGQPEQAQSLVNNQLDREFPADTIVQGYCLPA